MRSCACPVSDVLKFIDVIFLDLDVEPKPLLLSFSLSLVVSLMSTSQLDHPTLYLVGSGSDERHD